MYQGKKYNWNMYRRHSNCAGFAILPILPKTYTLARAIRTYFFFVWSRESERDSCLVRSCKGECFWHITGSNIQQESIIITDFLSNEALINSSLTHSAFQKLRNILNHILTRYINSSELDNNIQKKSSRHRKEINCNYRMTTLLSITD